MKGSFYARVPRGGERAPRRRARIPVKRRVVLAIALAQVALTVCGCVRSVEEPFVASPQMAKLSPKFQQEIRKILAEQCGTPSDPKLIGEPGGDAGAGRIRLGATVYRRECRPGPRGAGGGGRPAPPPPPP